MNDGDKFLSIYGEQCASAPTPAPVSQGSPIGFTYSSFCFFPDSDTMAYDFLLSEDPDDDDFLPTLDDCRRHRNNFVIKNLKIR